MICGGLESTTKLRPTEGSWHAFLSNSCVTRTGIRLSTSFFCTRSQYVPGCTPSNSNAPNLRDRVVAIGLTYNIPHLVVALDRGSQSRFRDTRESERNSDFPFTMICFFSEAASSSCPHNWSVACHCVWTSDFGFGASCGNRGPGIPQTPQTSRTVDHSVLVTANRMGASHTGYKSGIVDVNSVYPSNRALRFPSQVKVVSNDPGRRPVFSVGPSYIQLPGRDLASRPVWHRACCLSPYPRHSEKTLHFVTMAHQLAWMEYPAVCCVRPARPCGWCCVWFDLPWFGPAFYSCSADWQ